MKTIISLLLLLLILLSSVLGGQAKVPGHRNSRRHYARQYARVEAKRQHRQVRCQRMLHRHHR